MKTEVFQLPVKVPRRFSLQGDAFAHFVFNSVPLELQIVYKNNILENHSVLNDCDWP